MEPLKGVAVSIHEVQFGRPASNDDVVCLLEEWLERARVGDVQAIAVAGVRSGGVTCTEWVGAASGHFHQLNSAICILQYRYLRSNVAPE